MAKKNNKMKGFSSFLNNPVDFTLVITVLLLLSLGLVMVLSASYLLHCKNMIIVIIFL